MADEDDSQDNLRKALTFMGTAEFLPVIDLMDSMDSTGFHTVQPPSTPTSALLRSSTQGELEHAEDGGMTTPAVTLQHVSWVVHPGVKGLGQKKRERLKNTESMHLYIPHTLAWPKIAQQMLTLGPLKA